MVISRHSFLRSVHNCVLKLKSQGSCLGLLHPHVTSECRARSLRAEFVEADRWLDPVGWLRTDTQRTQDPCGSVRLAWVCAQYRRNEATSKLTSTSPVLNLRLAAVECVSNVSMITQQPDIRELTAQLG